MSKSKQPAHKAIEAQRQNARNLKEQGQQGNMTQNIIHQGRQQDR